MSDTVLMHYFICVCSSTETKKWEPARKRCQQNREPFRLILETYCNTCLNPICSSCCPAYIRSLQCYQMPYRARAIDPIVVVVDHVALPSRATSKRKATAGKRIKTNLPSTDERETKRRRRSDKKHKSRNRE